MSSAKQQIIYFFITFHSWRLKYFCCWIIYAAIWLFGCESWVWIIYCVLRVRSAMEVKRAEHIKKHQLFSDYNQLLQRIFFLDFMFSIPGAWSSIDLRLQNCLNKVWVSHFKFFCVQRKSHSWKFRKLFRYFPWL